MTYLWTTAPFEAMSKQGMDLLHGLTQRDPSKRITAAAALEHPWFREQLGLRLQTRPSLQQQHRSP